MQLAACLHDVVHMPALPHSNENGTANPQSHLLWPSPPVIVLCRFCL